MRVFLLEVARVDLARIGRHPSLEERDEPVPLPEVVQSHALHEPSETVEFPLDLGSLLGGDVLVVGGQVITEIGRRLSDLLRGDGFDALLEVCIGQGRWELSVAVVGHAHRVRRATGAPRAVMAIRASRCPLSPPAPFPAG
ncbi:MAG: hypothetical protein DI613_17970 [Kocuria rhizophila]|nr:MAG: hypothetical protein DI613_17970 [Kocuria rhizophila]